MHKTSQDPAERDLIASGAIEPPVDSQIYARKPKSPAKKDLPYMAYAFAKGSLW